MVAPWAAPFPTPYTVSWWRFTGDPAVKDEIGNVIETYANVVAKAVQGWDMTSTTDKLDTFAVAPEKFDAVLLTPPEFWPNIRDRIGLPVQGSQTPPTTMTSPDGSIAAGVFEVMGHDADTAGFHRWHAGNLIQLKKLAG